MYNDYININGKKLSYLKMGKGEITILLSSGFGTPYAFIDMYELADLLSKYCTCIIVDRFGYGKSDVSSINRNVENICEEYKLLLEGLNVKPQNTIFIGHSISSFYGIYLSKKLPLRGLVLIDNQKVTRFLLLLNKIGYKLYFASCKIGIKKIWDNSMLKLIKRDVPEKLQEEGIKIVKEKIPNIDIKSELNNFGRDVLNIQKTLDDTDLPKTLLVCRDNTFSHNLMLKNKIKKCEIYNVKKSDHFIHYNFKEEIANRIVNYYDLSNKNNVKL